MANRVQIELSAKDNVSRPLNDVSGKIDLLRARIERSTVGVRKMENALGDFAKQSVGASGVTGKLADSLMNFAGGGPVVLGVAAGIGLIITLYKNLQQSAKDLEDAKRSLAVTMAAQNGDLAATELQLQQAIEEHDRALKKLNDNTNGYIGTLAELDNKIIGMLGTFGTFTTAVAAAAKAFAITKLNEIRTEEVKASQEELRVNQQLLRQQVAELSTLEQLRKVRKLTTDEQQRYNTVLRQVQHLQYSANSQLALSAVNAVNATKAIKEKVKAGADEIDILLRGLSLNALSEASQTRLNTLLTTETAILNSNNASQERKNKAQERINAANKVQEDLQQRLLKQQNEEYDVLNRLAAAGDKSTATFTALQQRLVDQEIVLSSLVPQSKEYADQLERINKTRQSLATIVPTENVLENLLAASQFDVGAQLGQELLSGLESQLAESENRLRTLTPLTKDWVDEMSRIDSINDSIEKLKIKLDPINSELEKIKSSASFENLVDNINLASDSFQLLFESIASGGNAFANFGRGFSRMIAQMARAKAATNLAEGVENLAKAFGFISLGNVASAAAAKSAATGHFKAAALWGAVAGTAGGASNRGGASGGGFSQSNFGQTERDRPGDVTIIFPEGLIDLSNPTTQRQFARLLNQVAGNRQVNFAGA
jgi:hypothetical protein